MQPSFDHTMSNVMANMQRWEEVAERAGYDEHNPPPKDWTPKQQLDIEAAHAKEDLEMKCPHCKNGKFTAPAGEFKCECCAGSGKLPALAKLSALPDNGVFRYRNELYIVVDHIPEDRSSGGTTFQSEKGGQQTFWWDHDNPKVKYLGPGKLTIKIEVIRK